MELKKASRKKVKLRLGLSGASGFGKTYSALLLAYGMTSDWSKIAVVDTENGSAELYSNLGEYNVITLNAPFAPERYIEAIKTCENAGIEVIIIDSISHEWEGKGGCLEISDQITQASTSKNSYTSWAKVTPRHQAFVDCILQSKCHIITTVRRKQDYDMVKNGNKTEIVKVGMKEVTREGFEYELTVNFELVTDSHYVKASKDRTGLFMNKQEFVITSETGKQILTWCENGIDQLQEAVVEMDSCKTMDELKVCWAKWKQYQTDAKFSSMKDEIKAKLTPETSSEIDKILSQSIKTLEKLSSIEKVVAIWDSIPELHSNKVFIEAFNNAKARLVNPVPINGEDLDKELTNSIITLETVDDIRIVKSIWESLPELHTDKIFINAVNQAKKRLTPTAA